MGSNHLAGSIPPELSNLASARELYLDGNPLSGTLPLTLTNLTLNWLYSGSTDLCELAGAACQAWPAGIPDLRRTGVFRSIAIRLALGWNLISPPPAPANTLVTETLMSINGSYNLVYAYNAWDSGDPWKIYIVARPAALNDLKTMGPG